MGFRYLLKGIILFFFVVLSGNTLFGQGKTRVVPIELEQSLKNKYTDSDIVALGNSNNISSLDNWYCSDANYIDIVPDSWDLATTSIIWEIATTFGGVEYHPDWADIIGTGKDTKLRFYPDRVVAPYFGLEIYFIYYQRNEPFPLSSGTDFTYVYKTPSIFNLGPVSEFCLTGPINLTLDGSETGIQYQLYRDVTTPVGFPINGTNSPINFSVNQAGTYTVYAKNSSENSCDNIMAGSVVVHPLPVLTIGSNSPVCIGSTLNLTATGGTTYSWTGPNSYSSSDQNPTLANVTASMAGSYTVLVTDGNTCQNTDQIDVVINPRPTAVVSGTTTICNGETTTVSVALTGAAPWSLTYFDGTTSTPVTGINTSPFTFNVSPNSTTTYTVTALSDNNSCGAIGGDITGSAIVSVNPRPTSVLSGGGVTTCDGTAVNLSVTLTGTGPWNVSYTDGTNPFSFVANSSPYTLPVSPTSTSTYSITGVTDATGCTAQGIDMTGTALVTVNPRPTSTISIVGATELCDGGSTTIRFALTGTGPWSLTYTVNGAPTTVSPASTPFDLPVSPSATTTYAVSALNDVNCTATAADSPGAAVVTVYPRPTAVIGGTTTICDGGTTPVSIAFTGASPWDFSYTVNGGAPISVNSNTNNPYIISSSPTVNTTYLLSTLTDGNGCTALPTDLTGSAVISVNPRPTGVLSGGGTVCNGGNAPISLNLSGLGPWSISLAANGVPMPVINTNTNPYSFNVSPSSTTTYTLIGLTDSRCSALASDLSGSALVNINPRPTVVFGSNTTICDGQSVNLSMVLTGTSPWNINYTFNGTPSNTVIVGPSPGILNVSPTVSTTYIITSVQDGNGCLAIPSEITGQPVVTVNKRPTAVLSGNNTICNGSSTNLSVSLTGFAPWNFTYFDGTTTVPVTTSTSPHLIPVSPSSTRTYTITVLSDANGCAVLPTDMSGSALINVDDRPTGVVSIVGSDEFCLGGSSTVRFTFTGAGPWNLTYTVNGVPTTVNNVGSPYDLPVSPLATTTYAITALTDANCTALPVDISGSETITVYPLPTSTISGSTTICDGDITPITINLTGAAPWDIEYEVNGVTVVANNMLSSPIVLNVNPSINTTYVVTKITDSNGCAAIGAGMPGSALVTVTSRPTGAMSGGGTICEGTVSNLTFNLVGNAPFSINYTVNGTPVSVNGINTTPHVIPVTPLANTTYVFTGLSDASCSAQAGDISGTADFLVNMRPTGQISGSTTVCNGESATLSVVLTGAAPWSITYSDGINPNVTVPAASSPHTFSVNPSSTTTYTLVSVSDANSCSTIASDLSGLATVTVNPLPTANISGGGTICSGSSIGLPITFTGTGPWTFSYFDGTNTLLGNSTVSPYTLNVTPSATSTYSITVLEDANGCDGIPAGLTGSALVNVNPRPTAVLSGDQAICLGQTANLTVNLSGTAPWDITYSDGTTSNTISAGSTPFTLPVTPVTTSTYTITSVSDATSCNSIIADITGSAMVTVNDIAVSLAVQPPASVINTQTCFGNTLTYEATPSLGSGDYSYQYEIRMLPAGLWSNTGIDNATYTTSLALAAGTYELRVTVNDNVTSCSVTSSIATFEILPLPTVSLSVSDNDICQNQSVSITALPTGYTSYIFNIEGVDFNNGANNVYVTNSLAVGSNDIIVTVNNGSCSASSNTENVVVRDLPTTALALDDPSRTTVCISETVNLTASGADEYLFYVDGVAQGIRSATNTFSYSSVDNFNVYVIGYNTFNCEVQSGTINIVVSKPVAGLLVNPNRPEHCANETLIFSASGGTSYEFFYNSISQGVGASNQFTLFPPIGGDEVYVTATDAFGCAATSATRTLIVNPVPVITLVSDATDDTVCEGNQVVFTATLDVDYFYRFFILRGGIDMPVQDGSSNTFTYSSLQDGDQVYVVVRDENSCNSISPSVVMTINPNPVVTLNVLPSNHIGAGDAVQVVAGGADEYLFLLNGVSVGAWSTTNTWDFLTAVNGDVVSVIGKNTFGCEIEHPGITIQVDALPTIYELRAVSEEYCADELGVQLYLSGYETDVNYDLIDISSGPEVSFGLGSVDGGLMVWNNVTAGTYFVRATRTTGVGTTIDFTDQITVVLNPLPSVFNQLPNGTINSCLGGVNITLDNSQTGFNYSLLLNNVVEVETIAGSDGTPIAFAPVYFSGNYTIRSENATTGCISIMNGNTLIDPGTVFISYNIYSDPVNGHFCPGSTGVQLWLDGSEAGVDYFLYKGIQLFATIPGTGSAMLMATVTEEDDYMVVVSGGNGCITPMNGSVTVVADPLPTPFNVLAENNGHFCPGDAGVKISISGQQMGVSYTLWLNGLPLETKIGAIDDINLALEFDNLYNVDGIYSVTAELSGGCEGPMINTVNLVTDVLPTDFAVTGDAGFCEGASANILLNGSQVDVDYELFLDGTSTGNIISGNGGILTFTVNQEGDYTIEATFTSTPTGCSVFMSSSVTITEIPNPDVNVGVITDLTLTDCSNGAPVTLLLSEVGVTYELLKDDNGTLVPTGNIVVGDGNNINFPGLVFDNDATYRVSATRNGCSVTLLASVYIDVPGAISLFAISGNGNVCVGDLGATLGLSGSEVDVNYQLFSIGTGPGGADVAVGLPIPGTGFPLNFGLIQNEGDYYIFGVPTDITGCPSRMIGELNLRFNPLPIAYQMTGSGIYCGDVVGATIGLSGSEVDVNYKLLWYNGTFNQLMDNIDGIGLPLTFNGQFNQGDYTIYARNNITGCTSSMNGTVNVVKLPAPDVTGIVVEMLNTTYCSLDGGVEVGLSKGEVGVTYSIFDAGDVEVASVTPSATGPFTLGTIPAGTYRIEASRSGECAIEIASGISITEEPSPVVYELTVGSTGCASSVELELSGSELGVLYELYSDALMVLPGDDGYVAGYDAVGTGSPISFNLTGFPTGASFFWIKATYTGGCSSDTEWIAVNIKEAASAFTVELPSGTEYCASEAGVRVGVSATDVGVGYLLIKDGLTVDFLSGNGSAAQFGLLHNGGSYFVRAQNFNSGCSFDSPSFTIIMHDMPISFNLSTGGSVNVHEITIDNSELDVAYYLYMDGLKVQRDSLIGTESMLNFGTVSTSGVYTVLGVGEGGCSTWMNNSAVIFETPLIAVADTLYLGNGDLVGDIHLGLNDLLLPGIDTFGEGGNITFSFSDDEPYGKVTLDPVSGVLIYEKLPSFYGKDSLTYIIQNTDIPSRISSAKVYIMVGNKDFDENLSFLLPNAFSPNGDGINEKFVISGLGETEESNLEVFNRWGTIVFRSTGTVYENNWDGRSNISSMVSIGSELPNGTYYYIFKVKKNVEGKVVTKKYNGFVELRR